MLKIIKKNLKIRRFGLAVLVLLFVIFLVHPGRFSMISVSSVSQVMIENARLKFAHLEHQRNSDDELISNMKLLNKIQQNIKILGKVVNVEVPGVVCHPGGSCHPDASVSLPRVTLVVPFRDREEQLAVFLPYMHNFLQRQGLNYTIVVVNQLSKSKFNRAKLMNIGHEQVKRLCPECSCFIFHDVDLIPKNNENLYACLEKPRHMISSLNEFRYNLPYPEMTGGALSIRSDQFSILNGFSNQFYGWGGEDDEFHRRLVDHDLLPLRLPSMDARYISLTHKKQSLKSSIDFNSIKPELDGLRTLNYTVESMQLLRQYTLMNVLL